MQEVPAKVGKEKTAASIGCVQMVTLDLKKKTLEICPEICTFSVIPKLTVNIFNQIRAFPKLNQTV